MDINLTEKISIGYTCCGNSYKKSLKKKLEEVYFDNDNIYYCIVTDDKKYFEGINRKNLIVNELKDFYEEFPLLEKYEAFLESSDEEDYNKKFLETDYRFPFSTFRFNLLQAWRLGIKNASMLCTDTYINFAQYDEDIFKEKNRFWNSLSEWDCASTTWDMPLTIEVIEETLGLKVDDTVKILDAAGRLYVAEDLDSLKKLFDAMNAVVERMYEKDYMKYFYGAYARNDEYIMGPIYNALGITQNRIHPRVNFFNNYSGILTERYFKICLDGSIKDQINYEEFLKINEGLI